MQDAPRNLDLSDFEKGVTVGFHKNDQPSRDMSCELIISKSTVTLVIKKWKVSCDWRNVLPPVRSIELRERDQRMLCKEILKSTKQIAHIIHELQQTSGTVI
ncbi:hypothetical protein TNCV_1297521 [Trichonephila clavipes]|nr:hypothetical protein TNCV_1297521 [Trichonephila clavipes]